MKKILLLSLILLLTSCGLSDVENISDSGELSVVTTKYTSQVQPSQTSRTDESQTNVVTTIVTPKPVITVTTVTTTIPQTTVITKSPEPTNDDIITKLFTEKQSDVQVSGSGTVIRLLADDNDGSRHQRFILKLKSGHTLLVAHNIDLAPRIDDLTVGDEVAFYGEYYYSEQGGGVHWTHHDPNGRHVDGYLKKNGKTYQ